MVTLVGDPLIAMGPILLSVLIKDIFLVISETISVVMPEVVLQAPQSVILWFSVMVTLPP